MPYPSNRDKFQTFGFECAFGRDAEKPLDGHPVQADIRETLLAVTATVGPPPDKGGLREYQMAQGKN